VANVVFVAPFLLETTLRFVRATTSLKGTRVGLLTQDPADRIPAEIRSRLTALEQTPNALDATHIERGVRALGARLGSVDRLIGALEELQVPLGNVRAALGIAGMDGATAANFRDKARMKEVLAAAGLPCARHRRITRIDEAEEFVSRTGFPLVVKPVAGSGSRGTFRVGNDHELGVALRQLLPHGGRANATGDPEAASEIMLEEFVQGEEHSFDSVWLGGKVVWSSHTDYYPSPLEVMENPWIQWCVVLPREKDRDDVVAFRPLAEAALGALGMEDGLSHMEWFRRPDGSFAISEVGARPPGAQFATLISYAHDVDMYAAWARLMVFGEFDPPDRPFAAGAAFLRGQGSGRVQAVRGLEEAQRTTSEIAVEVRLPQRGQAPSRTYDGDGYVIVRHPETAVVTEALERLIRTIRVELG
jgi:formate-dependent phosphoribosylglycinamide formyltransferase (GAR transformylase)